MDICQISRYHLLLLILVTAGRSLHTAALQELSVPYADESGKATFPRDLIQVSPLKGKIAEQAKGIYTHFMQLVYQVSAPNPKTGLPKSTGYDLHITYKDGALLLTSQEDLPKGKSSQINMNTKGTIGERPHEDTDAFCTILKGEAGTQLLLATDSAMLILKQEDVDSTQTRTRMMAIPYEPVVHPHRVEEALFLKLLAMGVDATHRLMPTNPQSRFIFRNAGQGVHHLHMHIFVENHPPLAYPLRKHTLISNKAPLPAPIQAAYHQKIKPSSNPPVLPSSLKNIKKEETIASKTPQRHASLWLSPFLGVCGAISALYLFKQQLLFTRYAAIPLAFAAASSVAYGHNK